MRARWMSSWAARWPRSRKWRGPWTSDRRLGQATLGLAVVAAVAVGYAVYGSAPASAVRLPLVSAQTVRMVTPEGWAFFTASPRSVYPQAYLMSPAGSWVYESGSLAGPSDLFGLDRSKRAMETEIALLLQDVPSTRWQHCSSAPVTCLSTAKVTEHLVNTSTLQNLCGDVGIVEQQVLPWAWRGTPTTMPVQVLRAEVTCKRSQ
jgi:antimicrobial peptide system SdpA family protein